MLSYFWPKNPDLCSNIRLFTWASAVIKFWWFTEAWMIADYWKFLRKQVQPNLRPNSPADACFGRSLTRLPWPCRGSECSRRSGRRSWKEAASRLWPLRLRRRRLLLRAPRPRGGRRCPETSLKFWFWVTMAALLYFSAKRNLIGSKLAEKIIQIYFKVKVEEITAIMARLKCLTRAQWTPLTKLSSHKRSFMLISTSHNQEQIDGENWVQVQVHSLQVQVE